MRTPLTAIGCVLIWYVVCVAIAHFAVAPLTRAGLPPDPSQQMKQAWVQDTIQTSKEQNIWRELAIGMVDEIGPVKIIAMGLLFTLTTVGGTVFGVLKVLKRKA